ncbi:MAG: response regulator [Terriglobales bacterium]
MPQLALVVDDSMLIRHTVCRFLEQRGFAVETASDGAEALQMLGSLRPDLIVTDLMMPKMTGSELITAVKSDDAICKIPIIVLSGRRSAEELRPESRADYVIFKDIDIVEQLEKALATTVGRTEVVN